MSRHRVHMHIRIQYAYTHLTCHRHVLSGTPTEAQSVSRHIHITHMHKKARRSLCSCVYCMLYRVVYVSYLRCTHGVVCLCLGTFCTVEKAVAGALEQLLCVRPSVAALRAVTGELHGPVATWRAMAWSSPRCLLRWTGNLPILRYMCIGTFHASV